MAVVTDFLAAINQIASERGIDAGQVYQALKDAILVAYRKEYFKDTIEDPENVQDNLSVELEQESGAFKIIAKKEVVKAVENIMTQISVKDAQMISKGLKEGDVVEVELPSDDFGRIAAQTAKQVILQKIREFEKDAVLSEFSGKVGMVFTALMQRMQRGEVVFEIGKATAFMPLDEQIPNEFYKVGERYKVLLKDIVDTPRGKELVVSRADPQFLVELFKMEVPEIESGVVEVKAVAREAGSRSKMAVVSHQDGVDPIGSCVGQRGIRIANVMSELGEEKIDIIEWHEDLDRFVASALSPAKVEDVRIKEGTATVKVADDQLSLAIGRDGQNVRLAWKLTEVKIDIVGSDGKPKKAVTPVASDDQTDEEKEEKPVDTSEEEKVETTETESEEVEMVEEVSEEKSEEIEEKEEPEKEEKDDDDKEDEKDDDDDKEEEKDDDDKEDKED